MKPVLTVYKVFLSLSLAFQSDDGTHFHADKKYCLEIYIFLLFFSIFQQEFMSKRSDSKVPNLFPEAPKLATQTHDLDDEPEEDTTSSSSN